MASSLYERLGGEEGITAIMRDVLSNHLNNPLIKSRFEGKNYEEMTRLGVEFFCMGSGGPQKYSGKGLPATHKGMNISEQEFIAALDDILAALDKNKITPETRTEVLGIIYSMKSEIVRL